MTTIQLKSELYRAVDNIADDEELLKKVLDYVKKLATKKDDPTLMTKEEFYQQVAEAEAQYERGESTSQLPGESVSDMLKRCGYAL